MRIGEWDGLAPVTAAVALLVLALLPREPANALDESESFALEFRRIDGVWCRHDLTAEAGDAAATVCAPQLAEAGD